MFPSCTGLNVLNIYCFRRNATHLHFAYCYRHVLCVCVCLCVCVSVCVCVCVYAAFVDARKTVWGRDVVFLNCAEWHRRSVVEVWHKSDNKFKDGGQNGGRARVWLYLKRLYFISSAIAYCILPYASFYVGLSCYTVSPLLSPGDAYLATSLLCCSSSSPSFGVLHPPEATSRGWLDQFIFSLSSIRRIRNILAFYHRIQIPRHPPHTTTHPTHTYPSSTKPVPLVPNRT